MFHSYLSVAPLIVIGLSAHQLMQDKHTLFGTLGIIEVFNFQITSHLIWRDAQSALIYRLFIGKLPHFSVKHFSLAAVSESVRRILRTAKWWMSKLKEDFNMKNCRVVYN